MIPDTSAQDSALPTSGPRKKRLLFAGILAIAVATGIGFQFKHTVNGGASYSRSRLTTATAEIGDLTRDVSAEGKVVAASAPTLYAGSGGSITLSVEPGNPVKAGQVLATITSPELLANLAQARSAADAVKSAWLLAQADTRLAYASAEAAVQTTELGLASASNELARQTRAFDVGATSGLTVEQSRDAVARAKIAYEQAKKASTLKNDATRFELAARRHAYERAQLQVADLERQQEELSVRSPVDGQVGQIFVNDRSTVAKDAKLLAVVDLSKLEVQVQVAESQARELTAGMPGEISGNGGQWRGRVSSVSPEVVNGEVSARLRFDGAQPEALRQNQRLSVRVLLDNRAKILRIARGSFVEEGGGRWAYVVTGDEAIRRPIRLGAQGMSQVEILDGMKTGEEIIISGSGIFKNAERVQLIK
ncbi:efflux RND transporter periplasmic adaptor subunit [Massilia sp. CCM 9210]|uniref:efflux RND transporter periplasmic adaptor subunit n=1 Tax=Massilia scottii TaxID=3057166 RepID=UPI002796CC2B|nr:HlyD family efflux transporter periplasmic adaptor subunit [Massilia sp. CCM 9210]MDQ1816194.1 efflux RND transporter periplasmic adaptor subunit [Massilia sp. CCM 9210]